MSLIDVDPWNGAPKSLLDACALAPIQAVRRELDELLGDCPDRPASALDARVWLAELAWCDGETPEIAAAVTVALGER